MAINFIRFNESIKVKQEKRVVSVTLRPLITDCSGVIYFTDLQLQEGDRLTGYTPHTTTMLRSSQNPVRYHNGVVRSGDTVIIFNLSGISPGAAHIDDGGTSTGLDCYIYPIQSMEAGSISLSQGAGSNKAMFLAIANAGDEYALKRSREKVSLLWSDERVLPVFSARI